MPAEPAVRERTNDDLCTPTWILERVRKVHPIGLDPCSNKHSTVGARIAVSLPDDGRDALREFVPEGNEAAWVNMPYSDPLQWCLILRNRWNAIRLPSFALVKNDPSTKWSALLREIRTAQCDFEKRIRFEGGAHATGMFASTLFYAGPSPYLFAHMFQDVGDVRVYR